MRLCALLLCAFFAHWTVSAASRYDRSEDAVHSEVLYRGDVCRDTTRKSQGVYVRSNAKRALKRRLVNLFRQSMLNSDGLPTENRHIQGNDDALDTRSHGSAHSGTDTSLSISSTGSYVNAEHKKSKTEISKGGYMRYISLATRRIYSMVLDQEAREHNLAVSRFVICPLYASWSCFQDNATPEAFANYIQDVIVDDILARVLEVAPSAAASFFTPELEAQSHGFTVITTFAARQLRAAVLLLVAADFEVDERVLRGLLHGLFGILRADITGLVDGLVHTGILAPSAAADVEREISAFPVTRFYTAAFLAIAHARWLRLVSSPFVSTSNGALPFSLVHGMPNALPEFGRDVYATWLVCPNGISARDFLEHILACAVYASRTVFADGSDHSLPSLYLANEIEIGDRLFDFVNELRLFSETSTLALNMAFSDLVTENPTVFVAHVSSNTPAHTLAQIRDDIAVAMVFAAQSAEAAGVFSDVWLAARILAVSSLSEVADIVAVWRVLFALRSTGRLNMELDEDKSTRDATESEHGTLIVGDCEDVFSESASLNVSSSSTSDDASLPRSLDVASPNESDCGTAKSLPSVIRNIVIGAELLKFHRATTEDVNDIVSDRRNAAVLRGSIPEAIVLLYRLLTAASAWHQYSRISPGIAQTRMAVDGLHGDFPDDSFLAWPHDIIVVFSHWAQKLRIYGSVDARCVYDAGMRAIYAWREALALRDHLGMCCLSVTASALTAQLLGPAFVRSIIGEGTSSSSLTNSSCGFYRCALHSFDSDDELSAAASLTGKSASKDSTDERLAMESPCDLESPLTETSRNTVDGFTSIKLPPPAVRQNPSSLVAHIPPLALYGVGPLAFPDSIELAHILHLADLSLNKNVHEIFFVAACESGETAQDAIEASEMIGADLSNQSTLATIIIAVRRWSVPLPSLRNTLTSTNAGILPDAPLRSTDAFTTMIYAMISEGIEVDSIEAVEYVRFRASMNGGRLSVSAAVELVMALSRRIGSSLIDAVAAQLLSRSETPLAQRMLVLGYDQVTIASTASATPYTLADVLRKRMGQVRSEDMPMTLRERGKQTAFGLLSRHELSPSPISYSPSFSPREGKFSFSFDRDTNDLDMESRENVAPYTETVPCGLRRVDSQFEPLIDISSLSAIEQKFDEDAELEITCLCEDMFFRFDDCSIISRPKSPALLEEDAKHMQIHRGRRPSITSVDEMAYLRPIDLAETNDRHENGVTAKILRDMLSETSKSGIDAGVFHAVGRPSMNKRRHKPRSFADIEAMQRNDRDLDSDEPQETF